MTDADYSLFPPRTRLICASRASIFLLLLFPYQGWAADDLRLLISVEQPAIVSPYPARATLHYHNSGKEALWLYRRVRSRAQEGSSLEIRLEPLEVKDPAAITTPAEGGVFESAGLPRPKLVPLAPGEDTTEKVTLKLLPAKIGEGAGMPVWGRYRLTVVYSARYSNSAVLARETNAVVWQGETASEPVEIELQPPAGEGVVSGAVQGAQGQVLPDVIVTLSGEDERPLDQMATEGDGRFAFNRLPPATYWVTARRASLTEDAVVFRHIAVTVAEPAGSLDLILYPPDVHEARRILHKPVLIFVTDGQENPVGNASYEIVWSTGKVIENVKGVTGSDGRAAVELIPGRNFATLRRKGCRKQDHRMDVEPGVGVDAFKLAIECPAKR